MTEGLVTGRRSRDTGLIDGVPPRRVQNRRRTSVEIRSFFPGGIQWLPRYSEVKTGGFIV